MKNDKKLKRVVKILDKIIEEMSTDNMVTTTNQMQYTAALLITNKIIPSKPTANRKPRGGPPVWQQRLQKQIDQLRGDISIITEYIEETYPSSLNTPMETPPPRKGGNSRQSSRNTR